METPNCNFCGSNPNEHETIFINVKNTNHNLVECKKCHLRFYSPRVPFSSYISNGFGQDKAAEKEAQTMYENASFYPVKDQEKQKSIIGSYYNGIVISDLFRRMSDVKKCYEIGGSVGWLSYNIKKNHPCMIIDGCELNRFSVQVANEKFGLNYTNGVFDNISVKDNNYDVIFAMDYIEHTFTPFDDLKKCYGILKTGGLIYMKTFLEELDVDRTMEAPIGHSHHFFGYVLREMIEKSGFKILKWVLEGVQVIIIGEKI